MTDLVPDLTPPSANLLGDATQLEIRRCLDAIGYIKHYKGDADAARAFKIIETALLNAGVPLQPSLTTPYINTLPDNEDYPGDLELESKLSAIIRWNAMAMVVNANSNGLNQGGHISTYSSSAYLHDVGFNHFFKGKTKGQAGDQIYFQGHASPGNYARAFIEGRLKTTQLANFRRELAEGGGLSSYPHPYLMPSFWQFPTVSMGLGPIMALYQARFNRYLVNRGLLKQDTSHVYCFIGDGETDEPETLGPIGLAAREKLDNLIFIINCNLQRLDGPVRGNGKIIQDLESTFRGAGWNVIKVIWGSNWDRLLHSPYRETLIKRMNEVLDGEYQKYTVSTGSYIRDHFFGKYPELLELVSDMTDEQIKGLLRGGHDPKKIFTAFKAATEHPDQPTVILVKTVKGFGLGSAGEGKNVAHNQKKLNEKELREFAKKFTIPIDDDAIAEHPFYRPAATSPELRYYLNRRKELSGFLPERSPCAPALPVPPLSEFDLLDGSNGREISTTMAFVRILSALLKRPEIGPYIVPIVPDEARTFGMEALFRQVGIYASQGQKYEPVDSDTILFYKESQNGQILEEGINEAGSMCSWLAAGTAYSTHDLNLIPFYIYYSMFGFQRVGDLMWLAGDIKAKGFLLGGTAGRTTLNGEGLQHQDGHSLLLASTIPTLQAYDVSFGYEVSVIIQHGLKRMVQDNEDVFFYINVHNENYEMPKMPKGIEEGIIKGIYKFQDGVAEKKWAKAQLIGSGTILNEVLRAQEILKNYQVSADVWAATNYKRLRAEALHAQRYNMLNPTKKPQVSYVEAVLQDARGPFIAASDNMRIVSDQITSWVPGGLLSLGTDGFGRSETRESLRRFFEVDAACIVIATLSQLAKRGEIKSSVVASAMKKLGVDADKVFPEWT